MSEPKTYTLDVPGAVLSYDIRANETSTEPVLLIIGSPMGAAGFVTLAGHFPDRTVVTYDPRGAGRSRRTDGARQTTPDEHADDLHRIISAPRRSRSPAGTTGSWAANTARPASRTRSRPPCARSWPANRTDSSLLRRLSVSFL
ncbi:MAG: alpha/beta fold hydrolase [Streptosporangiaceae bacterium]